MIVYFVFLVLAGSVHTQFISFEDQVRSAMLDYIQEEESEDLCRKRLEELVDLSKPQNLAFFDAMGKPISGLTVGNYIWLGNYDLCLELSPAHLLPCKTTGLLGNENVTVGQLLWTSCLPLDCKDEFIDIILTVVNETAQKYLDISIPILENELTTVCEEPITYDTGAYITVVVISFFVLMTCIGSLWDPGTVYVTWVHASLTDTSSGACKDLVIENGVIPSEAPKCAIPSETPNSEHSKANGIEMLENVYTEDAVYEDIPLEDMKVTEEPKPRLSAADVVTVLGGVFKCFALQKNMKMLLDTTTKPGQILCLNGIRVLSIGWVLLGHTYLTPLLYGPIGDPLEAFQLSNRTSFEIILNGFPSVDSFFLMSGFLVSYLLIKKLDSGMKFRQMALKYYLHRYIRLTVPYAVVILLEGFLYRQYVAGPFSGIMQPIHQRCVNTWMWNLLYLNNILPWDNPSQCIGQAWYLGNDMQFYIVAPLFVYLLWRSALIGNLVCWITILCSITAAGVQTYLGDFGPTPFRSPNDWAMFSLLYTKPHIRIVPYLVGIFGGWFYARYHKQMSHFATANPVTRLSVSLPLWVITIAIQYGVVFGIHTPNLLLVDMSPVQSVTYAMFNRVAWGIALLVQILLCQSGMGGVIGKCLSWRGWLPLSRLAYSLYLLHYGINTAWLAQMRHIFAYKPDLQMVIIVMGFICFVNCVAALLFLCVEQPTANLERYLDTPPANKPPTNKPPSNKPPTNKPPSNVYDVHETENCKQC